MPLNQQHQPAKSSTPASSSIIAIHGVASPTTRNGRPSTASLSSQNPVKSSALTSNLPQRALSPDSKRKNNAPHSRANSVNGITDGVGNLNRWSQSTVSSKSSATVHNKRSSFARRLSGSFGSFGGFGTPQSPTHKSSISKAKSQDESSKRTLIKAPPAGQAPSYQPLRPVRPSESILEDVVAPSAPETRTSSPVIAEPTTPSTNHTATVDHLGGKQSVKTLSKWQEDRGVDIVASSTVSSHSRTVTTRTQDRGRSKSEFGLQPHEAPKTLFEGHRSPDERDPQKRSGAGHSRNREIIEKGSGGGSSTSSARSLREGNQRRKAPSQKAMLSKALQKANHAVQLDNAQNFEGAMDAYGDACDLLQQVMLSSAGDEDRKKLEAIRNTYRNRIHELEHTEIPALRIETKALPNRPTSCDSKDNEPFSPITDDDEAAVETVKSSRITHDQRQSAKQPALTREQLPPRRQSLMPFVFSEHDAKTFSRPQENDIVQSRLQSAKAGLGREAYSIAGLATPMFREYMPEPLSPRRPASPKPLQKHALVSNEVSDLQTNISLSHHTRQDTTESTSWLDTIDESDGSSGSSVRSCSSSSAVRREYWRNQSSNAEANFDAALDAAVEAAYGEGLEPIEETYEASPRRKLSSSSGGIYTTEMRRNIVVAKQRVREAEREAAIALIKNQKQRRIQAQSMLQGLDNSIDPDYAEDEEEEEQRLLEEMTREYIMDDLENTMQTKSALPRQSDSSGFSGRTWASSAGSISNTVATSLSAVVETATHPRPLGNFHTQPLPPAHPPPSAALPPPPTVIPKSPLRTPFSQPPSLPSVSGLGVRERRLSGQKVKQLTIETNSAIPSGIKAPMTQPLTGTSSTLSAPVISPTSKSATIPRESQQLLLSSSFRPHNPPIAPSEISNSDDGSQPNPAAPPLSPRLIRSDHARDNSQPPPSPSPMRHHSKDLGNDALVRKNVSSNSLKSLRHTFASAPPIEEPLGTPLSKVTLSSSQTRNLTPGLLPGIPPPASISTRDTVTSHEISNRDRHAHSLMSPESPNGSIANPPATLEPCPDSSLLRPYWLLRCIYQIVAHPRGGYLTTRLFFPRDVWLVKNVKLKYVEEKVANCDLLTAALLKLGRADTLDADAVLREMQAFESVLENVQAIWSKKLSGDVGLQSSAALFKGSPVTDETAQSAEGLTTKASTTGGKYLSTWRKLRSKNSSGPGLILPINGTSRDGTKDTLTIRSLPMSSSSSIKLSKRDVSKVHGIGQHASYMISLARLCDAAQVLDQIARQIEDPGLKHSSATHIGLEFSTRHAAEFFAFYVCRFVLIDFEMMLVKFIKRGSEWAAS